ncbi:hypothetical protein [Metapseudomonas otitidis]|uniref:hypothetical protein n=1 Tax=Metapseudomonas otitidis TaxID=319939 RepID=UPI0008E9C6AD|nr:hypothetical protein [Pseudomonas otitidis]SFA66537.1 hypothetical protein SAMN05216263_12231 [Pseudomonas otitidis]
MQLNIERGEPMTGKTVRLRQVAEADGQSERQILVGRHCTTAALERSIRRLAMRGANVICIDECSEEQIARLQALQERLPSNLTIHAVVAS